MTHRWLIAATLALGYLRISGLFEYSWVVAVAPLWIPWLFFVVVYVIWGRK